MTSRRRLQLWIFLGISALSLGAGMLIKRADAPLDLMCSIRSAQQLETPEGQQWLLNQYALDLRADGQGDVKTSARLLQSGGGQTLGYLHRTTSFTHRNEDQRLLLHVQQSGKSETDSLESQQLESLGLFIFTEDSDLTFRVRRLDPSTTLISNGLGVTLFCEQNLPRN